MALALALAIGLAACSRGAGAHAPVAATAGNARPTPAVPPAPQALQERLDRLGRAFGKAGRDERVGIAVRDVTSGWTAGYDLNGWYPQQSVSKLWVAISVLHLADQHRLRLNEPILVRREDLSVFYQPIRRCIGANGYRASVDELLTREIGESDNTANDVLMRRVGGPAAVARFIRGAGVRGVRTGIEEHDLQAAIAGLKWQADYGQGWNFQQARERLPLAYRTEMLKAYLADPLDGATPAGMVDALSKLQRRELISDPSTAHLLGIMQRSPNGPRRLRSGLPSGWRLAHKTGTGQDLGGLSTGYNDVGVVTAPDGRTYAVAVMIASTRRPIGARMAFMGQVARELVAFHDHAAPPQIKSQESPELGENPEDSRSLTGRVRCSEFHAMATP